MRCFVNKENVAARAHGNKCEESNSCYGSLDMIQVDESSSSYKDIIISLLFGLVRNSVKGFLVPEQFSIMIYLDPVQISPNNIQNIDVSWSIPYIVFPCLFCPYCLVGSGQS